MKKSAYLAMMMAMATIGSQDEYGLTERGNVGSNRNPKPIEPIKHIPFNKSEGVVKMIEDYNLIKRGESKKGIIKQSRIKNMVDGWLKSGMLKEEDLNITS